MKAFFRDVEGRALEVEALPLEVSADHYFLHMRLGDDEFETVLSLDALTNLRDALDDALGEPPVHVPVYIIGAEAADYPPARRTRGHLRLVK
jgi:hypothetical protein